MTSRVRVLCRPAIAAGFRLAGLDPDEASDVEDGARRFLDLVDAPDAGVLLVQDDLYAALPEAERRRLSRRPLPLVVPFPAAAGAVPAEGMESFIAELLRQAIGYRVRIG